MRRFLDIYASVNIDTCSGISIIYCLCMHSCMSTTHTFYVCKHNTLMTLKKMYLYQRCRIGALFENSPVRKDNPLPGQLP